MNQNNEPFILIENFNFSLRIGKTLGTRKGTVGLPFSLGKFYLILGNHLSGKTTLLSIIGLTETHVGENYTIDNYLISDFTDKHLAKIRHKYFGFTYKESNLDFNLTVFENIMVPLLLDKLTKKEKSQKVKEVLRKFKIEKLKNKYPIELSNFELQLVSLARSLVNNPYIILADEPTENLEKEEEIKLLEIYKLLIDEGRSIIMTSKNKELKKYADEILISEDGILKWS